MPTPEQLARIAEQNRHSTDRDFNGCNSKDANAEKPRIIIYKGYDESYCPQCGGSVVYSNKHDGMCVTCCQSFLYMPDTEKPKQPIVNRPAIKLNFKVGLGEIKAK